MEAGLADALAGRALEDGDPIMLAGSAAAGVELLQILVPAPLHVGQSGAYVVGGCAEAHQLIDWHGLGNGRKNTAGDHISTSHKSRVRSPWVPLSDNIFI